MSNSHSIEKGSFQLASAVYSSSIWFYDKIEEELKANVYDCNSMKKLEIVVETVENKHKYNL